jgi:Kef-type K+ transport system membrane component KefB
LISRLHISQGMLSLALMVVLTYGLAAELVGNMASIIGAFIAGLMFARTHEKSQFENGILSLGYGLFIPIFFVGIGLSINLRQMDINALWLLLAVSAAAAIAKVAGAGLGSRLGGFTTREALLLGTGMIPRGEVSLIVAAVGLKDGLINSAGFSAVVGAVMVTTLITPPLLRALYTRLGTPGQLPTKSSPKTEVVKESA